MRLIVVKDYESLSRIGALLITAQVLLEPKLVLGLATGETPVGTYKEMVKMFNEGIVDYRHVTTFNLDEYVGLNKKNHNSYHYFMQDNLFSKINIKEENIFLPEGIFTDGIIACEEYEKEIKKRNGIDLQVLGIGRNGHIGFNEPDIKFEDITHIVNLDEQTIKDNSRFFGSEELVPKKAISMGIKTIMRAKRILLLATGEGKADVLNKMINGPITPNVPASVLRLHPQMTIIVDSMAASQLGYEEGVYSV